MTMNLEQIKSVDMVGLLTRLYGMEFEKVGAEYVAFSPFQQETKPSFFVRQVDGRWLFKDFSSGHGGSLIDFVQIKENIEEVSAGIAHLRSLLEGRVQCQRPAPSPLPKSRSSYDIEVVYERIKKNDVTVSREYLDKRGVCGDLVEELVRTEILLHNRYQNKSYCCFAVRDEQGQLQALDNHEVDGPAKFVLGKKEAFSLDWEGLSKAHTVFITEGIIDYLSVKTLEGSEWLGLSMMGNIALFSAEVLTGARRIISALDSDDGGLSGFLDLLEMYPDKQIEVYDLEGYNDANELLGAARQQKRTRLNAKRKLELYRAFVRSSNRSELARKWGVDRSYMYEIVRECEQMILEGFEDREPGRKPAGKPRNVEQAWDRIEQLEREKHHEMLEKQTYYARSEFLKLRLKYAEGQDEAPDPSKDSGKRAKPASKKQIKKKRKKKR